jgi:hypothetical protein
MTLRVGGRRRARAAGGFSALAALGCLVVGTLAVGACSGDDGDGSNGTADSGTSATSTTMNTGGIEVPAPDGWTAIPVPQLGFGLAVPPGWESTVLSDDALDALTRASPAVPGFLDLAHAAADVGAVFYAAGVDDAGRIADVKVRAAPGAGVTTVEQLEDYARQLAESSGLTGASIEVVEGTELPTVRIRYQVSADGSIEAAGTETLVAGPNDIVWSVIVTSEDAATHDALAEQITDTLSFAPDE